MSPAAIGDEDFPVIRRGENIRTKGIGGVDANVVTRMPGKKFAAVGHGPFLQVRGQPIGIIQNERRPERLPLAKEIRRANQRRDHGREGRGGVAGIFLPPFLAGDGTVKHEVARRPPNERGGVE